MPPCTADRRRRRALTLDRDGNLLVPVYLAGHAREGRRPAGAAPPARDHQAAGSRSRSRARSFVTSLTTEGPASAADLRAADRPDDQHATEALAFFGSVDVRQTVLRIAHRRGVCQGGTEDGADCNTTPRLQRSTCADACVGGANDGLTCGDDGDCPGGACGELFDASGVRVARANDGGAIVLPRAASPAGTASASRPTTRPARRRRSAPRAGDAVRASTRSRRRTQSRSTAASAPAPSALFVLHRLRRVASDGVDRERGEPLDVGDFVITPAGARHRRSRCPSARPSGLLAQRRGAPDLRHIGHAPSAGRSSTPDPAGVRAYRRSRSRGGAVAFLRE